jgi:hypothetical protein
MKRILIFTLILYAQTVFAEWHKKLGISSAHAGFRYSSLLMKKGVIFYRDYQVDPVITVFFFDDKLEFLGDSISYRDFIYSDQIRFRTKLASVNDSPLIPAHKSIKDSYPNRDDTTEWTNTVEFFVPGYGASYLAEIDLNYSIDLSEHEGHSWEIATKVKLFDFKFKNNTLEPNLYVTYGGGDSKHNEYFYGTTNKSGATNLSAGLWLNLPDKVDRYYPTVQLVYFTALDDFKKGTFSEGRSEGVLFSFISALKVLD